MKKILVPVDFSPHTQVSCQYAYSLAGSIDAEIILFHSFFDQLYFSDGGFTTGFESGIMLTDEIILDFYKQKEQKLNDIARQLQESNGQENRSKVKVICRMESGDPEIQIINAIEQMDPDLIVMGSAGMGKKRLFSGSVARRIIDHVSIPVIAVPEQARPTPLKNIVYMTAFDPDDEEVIIDIDSLLAPMNCTFNCVHLLTDDNLADVNENMNKLSGMQALDILSGRIYFHILEYDNQLEKLKLFIDEQKIDLIAFIPHKRNPLKNLFFQGITREDLFLTHIPVMAVKSDH